MLADQEALDQLRRLIVTRTAILHLVNGRNCRSRIRNLMNEVRVAVTIPACRLAGVSASANLAQRPAVAVTAAFLIGQGLEIAIVVLWRHVRMAVCTHRLGMRRRIEGDVFVTLAAVFLP